MTESYLTFTREVLNNWQIASLALIGGILPAFLWLWLWLKEDRRKPEPKIRIALTFFLGATMSLLTIPIQYSFETIFLTAIPLVILGAFSEELFKYLSAYLSALSTKVTDEPIDSIIYLITAALGFSAMENSLYLLAPLFEGSLLYSFTLLNFRFVGASLLHVAASGIIGIFIAFSFKKPAGYRRFMTFLGLILATGLHALFNLLIMKGEVLAMISVLAVVWTIVVVILLLFEKVKTLPKNF